jgi:ketosteroid isomerase-like protein
MSENERIIRELYQLAEDKNFPAFADLFGENGLFVDMSSGATFQGKETGKPVAMYAAAFPDMRRKLGRFIESGNVVVVELTLNGTHQGELVLPHGVIAPTQRRIEVPCCDVFLLEDGKVALFRCYNLASVLFAQLGVLDNLSAAVSSNKQDE